MARRTLVSFSLKKGAALAQEHAITEMRLAPTAVCISIRANMVSAGTMKMPLAIPNTPPNTLVANASANSHNSSSKGISAAGQSRDEADMIAAVVQPLIVHRAMLIGIGGALYEKDRIPCVDA